MSRWVSFDYRDFHDVPRTLVFALPDGRRVLLDCRFCASLDDYEEHYTAYELENDVLLTGSWESLAGHARRTLGSVPVRGVHFDPTRRKEIDTEATMLAAVLNA